VDSKTQRYPTEAASQGASSMSSCVRSCHVSRANNAGCCPTTASGETNFHRRCRTKGPIPGPCSESIASGLEIVWRPRHAAAAA
jgi:hypothetical protein